MALRALSLTITLAAVVSCSGDGLTFDSNGRVAAIVDEVIDGDTITVRIGRRRETIRLIGVDTPETKHPTKPVGCFGPEASDHTKTILRPDTRVALVRDAEARDRYGRLLAYVYRSHDDLFVNAELIAGGWGVPLSIEPNTAFEATFAAAASAAEASNLGLWGHCRG